MLKSLVQRVVPDSVLSDRWRIAKMKAFCKEQKRHLLPGFWSTFHPKGATHVRMAQIPPHLAATKWHEPSKTHDSLTLVWRLILRAYSIVWIPRATKGDQEFSATIVLPATDAAALLLDTQNSRVLRLMDTALNDQEIVLRKQFSEYIRTPGYHVPDDRLSVAEDLVVGDCLIDLSCSDRTDAMSQLLLAYCHLTENHGEPNCDTLLAAAFDGCDEHLSTDMRVFIERFRSPLLQDAHRWKHVPSHGDLSGENLIVDGRTLTAIDAQSPERLPFFHDLFYLAIFEAHFGRTDLMGSIRSGEYDPLLSRLWSICGLRWDRKQSDAYFVSAAIVNAYRYQGHRRLRSLELYLPPIRLFEQPDTQAFGGDSK